LLTEVAVLMRGDPVAVEIGRLYRLAKRSLVDSVKHAVECGQKLIAQKENLKHGEWLPWLQDNADVLGFAHDSTAQRLMKLVSNPALARDLDETSAVTMSRKLWGHNVRGTQGTGENEWYTPAAIISDVRNGPRHGAVCRPRAWGSVL